MSFDIRYVFLDAMVLLHFEPIEHILWADLLNSNSVQLILARITIRELDKHKATHPSPKIRDRARRNLKRVETALNSADRSIRENVELSFFDMLPSIDYRSVGLNPEWPDDILIATILEFKQQNINSDVVLVTNDTGARIKAISLNIEVFELPDKLKLPSEPDPLVEENRKLKERLSKLTAAMPELSLCFDGGEIFKKIDCSSKAIETAEERVSRIASEVEKERTKNQYKPSKLFLRSTVHSPGQQELKRFLRDLNDYIKQYEAYLNNLADWKIVKSKTFPLEFSIVNNGGAPADDIDILIYFPDGFLIIKEKDLPKIPKPPEKPIPPRSSLNLMKSPFDIMKNIRLPSYDYSSFSSINRNIPKDVTGPKIRRTDSYEVEYHINRLKHGFSIKLKAVYLDYSESEEIKSFEAKYWINAGNVPESAEGKLHVVIESET